MIRVITLLTEGFADWEAALINATGRLYYGFDTRFASPRGAPVISSGGLSVTPDLAIEALDLLIIVGGTIWRTDQAPRSKAWSEPPMQGTSL